MSEPLCEVCNDDGWVAYPVWADATKQKLIVRKVVCPRGCPLADPDEPDVQPALFITGDEVPFK